MANSNEIRITIEGKGTSKVANGSVPNTSASNPIDDFQPKGLQSSISKNMALAAGSSLSIGKSVFNFAVTNYGSFTNDYISQNSINNGMSALGQGSLALAGVGMMATGNVVGGSMMLLAQAVSLTLNEVKRIKEEQKQDTFSSLMRERVGLATQGGGRK